MSSSTTMTIRLPLEVHEKLSRLADGTRRSRSWLAAEALSAYVDRELTIIGGIKAALGDIDAGHVTSHEQAMDEVDALIARIRTQKG